MAEKTVVTHYVLNLDELVRHWLSDKEPLNPGKHKLKILYTASSPSGGKETVSVQVTTLQPEDGK